MTPTFVRSTVKHVGLLLRVMYYHYCQSDFKLRDCLVLPAARAIQVHY